MRGLGLPIWIGEFGPLYNGTPDQAEERYQLVQDQLDIYRDYQASWALWLYKDIGLQGLVFAAADSPYMRLLKDFLAKKERLGADSWGGTDGAPPTPWPSVPTSCACRRPALTGEIAAPGSTRSALASS